MKSETVHVFQPASAQGKGIDREPTEMFDQFFANWFPFGCWGALDARAGAVCQGHESNGTHVAKMAVVLKALAAKKRPD